MTPSPKGSRLLINTRGQGAASPLLSIAVPTYKRFDLLAETLASVFNQDFPIPVEILVVDNDPENDELAVREMARFKDKPLLYYKNIENLGMFGNWNQCLALARGTYITLLHDDDLLLPAFSVQFSVHQERLRQYGILGFQCGLLDQRDDRPAAGEAPPAGAGSAAARLRASLRSQIKVQSSIDLFFANPFRGTLAIVMHRRTALDIGGFDPNWSPISDYEFWCRWARASGDIPVVRTKVGLYRMRQNESMLAKTRKAFVTESLALRKTMIAQGSVPAGFKLLLGPLTRIQETLIENDWRTGNDKPLSCTDKAGIFVWRCLTFMLTRSGSLFAAGKRRPS